MHYSHHIYFAQVAITLFSTLSSAHSWVEQLMVIDPNGTFTGAPGFSRGNVLRGPGFSDPLMVNLLPPDGRPITEGNGGILDTDLMCKDSQKQQVQTDGSPRLQASPGSLVALRYQENGHVTLPDNQKGKPANRGTVYIYGTTQPSPTDTFVGIFQKWNTEGTGGDKRGKLLATQDFDDGQCYQINGGTISVTRQAQFPHQAAQPMGADIWCQNNIKIPSDAPTGKPYTIYWVWSWPTEAGADPGLPNGKQEIYTSCMDIDMNDNKGAEPATNSNQKNVDSEASADNTDLNNAAIPKYMKELNGDPTSSGTQSTIEPQNPSTSQTIPTATATDVPGEKTVTVYVTVTPTTEAASSITSTTVVIVPQSTVVLPGETILSTATAESTPTALPASTPGSISDDSNSDGSNSGGSNSDGTPYPPRCVSCKGHKRSRLFGSARYHKH